VSRPVSFRTRTRRPLLVGATVSLLLAACGSAAPTPSPSGAPPSAGPGASDEPSAAPSTGPASALLLEVTSEGGFINPSAGIAALPDVVVDADGHIYTPAPSLGATGSPLVPPVDVRDVGPAGAGQILEAIRAAGLDHEGEGGGIVADTGSAVFTVVIDGTTIVSRFGRGGGGPGIPGGVGGPGESGGDAPGAAAFDLLARLTDPSVAWGGTVAPLAAYAPVGYRVFDAPGAPADAAAGGTSVPWPLPTGLAEFGTPAVPDLGVNGLRSGILTGDAAATLAPVLDAATTATAFVSGDQPFTLWVRPLFPDELGG
jgi:hypothetical protein